MGWQTWAQIAGVAGLILGVFNLFANLRLRTIGNQAALLSELRPLLVGVLEECITLRHNLNFDRYDVSKSIARVPPSPEVLNEAIERIPNISSQLLSPSKRRIDFITDTIRMTREQWQTLEAKLNHEGIHPDDAMQTQGQLDAYSGTLVRLLREYVDAITAINKGKLWPRWKYRDHWPITSKVLGFRSP
jgi:hypothetical protein